MNNQVANTDTDLTQNTLNSGGGQLKQVLFWWKSQLPFVLEPQERSNVILFSLGHSVETNQSIDNKSKISYSPSLCPIPAFKLKTQRRGDLERRKNESRPGFDCSRGVDGDFLGLDWLSRR
jgi:hypothetical protein